MLGHWVGDGAEGANFWLSVVTDLQGRGVEDIFIACIDGLTGFKDAIHAVFPRTQIQRCIIHQVRQSLQYVSWKDRKAFVADLRLIYQAPTREAGEERLLELGERWGDKYVVAVRSWERNWEDLATMYEYPAEIRRLIYTTNTVEGYNRQLRKVIKDERSPAEVRTQPESCCFSSTARSRRTGRPRSSTGRRCAISWRFGSRDDFRYR